MSQNTQSVILALRFILVLFDGFTASFKPALLLAKRQNVSSRRCQEPPVRRLHPSGLAQARWSWLAVLVGLIGPSVC
ncbi:hypothetical protein BDW74DRAFT_123399 [Aspergillus multicolor]|uniref:uncharacterized protein n=1 Tax=Aspergillus multicolor TaxID=41759 RepID=UPI003CCCFF52